jgi:2-C-methyl-D-erythritol 4-phosphate cytidylyltransferase
MKRFVVIVAGGKGLRMGTDLPKQFIPIAGKPVLMHTIEAFHKWDSEAEIIVVLPKEHQAYWKMLCEEIKGGAKHTVADGGETRFHSVRNGLSTIKNILANRGGSDKVIVGIHDGVRPFVSSDVIERCFEKADEFGAAIPVIPVVDSLRIKENGETKAVNRADYVAVQTPQVFEWKILLSSYDQPYSDRFTDDASVVESTGRKIATVSGNPENIKLTTPIDLLVAEKTIELKTPY